MHLDVQDLRSFYYRTQLGRAAQRSIRDQVVEHWPDTRGLTVAGFGFAVPLLRPFLAESRRVIALMPGPQGVMAWPQGMPNVSVLCEETLWPVETGTVDRLVLLHGLETSENPSAVLEEAWRVLAPGARALFIVPNRSGLWARRDATPFGFGRPYTASQIEAQLRRHDFLPERHGAALFQPPSERRFWLKTGGIWEGMGRRVSKSVAGGVLIVEASKQLEAPRRPGLPVAVRRPLRILDGIAQPGAEPV
jgi:SAM-dependent methyltransferase